MEDSAGCWLVLCEKEQVTADTRAEFFFFRMLDDVFQDKGNAICAF